MKIKNIIRILNENQISEFPYKKQNGINHNQLWIEKKLEDWRAYYVERGEKKLLEKFENEDQACNFFLNSLINNNVVKIDFDTVYKRKWRLKKIKKGRKIEIRKSNKKLLQDIRSDLNNSIYLKVLELLTD